MSMSAIIQRQVNRLERLPVARVLRKLRLLPYLNFHERLSIDGHKVVIPLKGETGFNHSWSTDDAFLSIYRRLLALKPGGLVDVGANIGQTLVKFRVLEPQRRYIGFEPNPLCVDYLVEMIKANAFAHCEIVPSGLAESAGVLRLFLNDETDSSATLIDNFRPATKPTIAKFVCVNRLDDLVPPLGIRDIAIMKIDVEGFELDVLKGAQNFIKTERPFILCEILPIYDEHTEIGAPRAARQRELLALLRGLDYAIARVRHEDGGLVALDDIEVHSDLGLCDYVFYPRECDPLAAGAPKQA